MRKSSSNRSLILYSVLLVMSARAEPDSSADTSDKMSVNSTILVDPLLKFTSNIFTRVRKDKENVLLSPISIHKALNIVLLGADSGTQTESELLKALGYPQSDSPTTINEYHESYASIIEVFKEASKAGVEALKAIEKAQRALTTGPSDGTYRSTSTEKPPVLEIWNMMVTKNKEKLNPIYLENVKKYYDSSVERIQDDVPESKANIIANTNKWAKEAGFDKDVLKATDLDENFSAMLMSAIRVQAFWFDEFSEHVSDNQFDVFYNFGLKDHSVKKGKELVKRYVDGAFVEFTDQNKTKYKRQHEEIANKHGKCFEQLLDLDFHAVEVPLRGNLKFTIFEPLTNGKGDELGKLVGDLLKVDSGEEKTKLAKAFEIIDSDEAHNHIDYLSFPAFKFESDIKLKQPLMTLGLNRMFDSMNAQLSNITTDKVYVSDAKHQAVIEVNKFGLKAAALTQIRLTPLMAMHTLDPIQIVVKNPFMFVVRYEKLPLFIGQLVHL